MFKIVAFFFIISLSFCATAQLTDIARLEYSFIPKTDSEDQYTRLRFLLNYPIEIKEDSYLILGAAYNQIFLNLDEDKYKSIFNVDFLETLTVLDFSIGYTLKMNSNWRIAFKITPRLASTLTIKITKDDFFLNGGLFVIKDRIDAKDIKPYRLILGLTYNTTAGLPLPLPLVNYTRFVNDNWSYTLGVPKMNVKRRFDEKNSLQAYIGLDGYFAHIQEPESIMINETRKNVESVSLSVLVFGFGYEYAFTKNLVFYTYAGHTIRLNNRLRNANRDDIFQLDNANSFYLRGGIKFKI